MTEATTFTLATIHERHENLALVESDLASAKARPEMLAISQHFHEVAEDFSPAFLRILQEELELRAVEIVAAAEVRINAARAELKRDALEAFAAFYEGT